MRLQHNPLTLLHPLGRWPADDDIAHFVHHRLQPQPLAKLHQKFPHLLFVMRRPRHLEQIIEILPHICRLEILQGVFERDTFARRRRQVGGRRRNRRL